MNNIADAFEVSRRFSHIRPMLDKVITNSEHVIGSYVMTICTMIGQGCTDQEIVDNVKVHGIDIRPEYR